MSVQPDRRADPEVEWMMKNVTISVAAAAVVLLFWHSTAEGQKGPFGLLAPALVSPPLSINPNDGQPLCLVSNVSATDTIAVTIELVDGTGTTAVTTPHSLAPGAIESATSVLQNFFSYCRVTPGNSAQLPLLRATHCVASGNTSRSCVEAR
jgi:hypothetical protein